MTRLPIGIHKHVPEAVYHADPAETPSASSGALRTLLAASPQHAWTAHPRLNPAFEAAERTPAQDRGTIIHALVLDTEPPFQVLDVSDYKKKEAQELRDQVIAAGLIPVKVADMEELQDAASAVRERLRGIPDAWAAIKAAIADGMAEATLIWEERGVLCRVRYDTLAPAGHRASYDLKTTGITAEPSAFGRKLLQDYSIQSALYPRAVRALRGDEPLFVTVAAEFEPPYGVTLHALDPEARALADERVNYALESWRTCMRTGVWPSYPTPIHFHSPRPYDRAAWEESKALAEQAAEQTWRAA